LNNQHKEHVKLQEEKSKQFEEKIKQNEENVKTYQDNLKEYEEKNKVLSAKIEEKTAEISKLISTIDINKEDGLKELSNLQALHDKLEKENQQLQQDIEKQVSMQTK
jgi:chromosome segregation ATPase